MLIEELALRCPHCDKIFWGVKARERGETHLKKLGVPKYGYKVGFTFIAELGMAGVPAKVRIAEQGCDKKHHPYYRLQKVDDGEFLRAWVGEGLIREALTSVHNRTHVKN